MPVTEQGVGMAYDVAKLENPRTGHLRKAPLGYSWTTLFFGPFPMLFRGAWKWFFIILITNVITSGLAALVWSFLINRLYLNDLLDDGFALVSAGSSSLDKVSGYARRRVAIVERGGA